MDRLKRALGSGAVVALAAGAALLLGLGAIVAAQPEPADIAQRAAPVDAASAVPAPPNDAGQTWRAPSLAAPEVERSSWRAPVRPEETTAPPPPARVYDDDDDDDDDDD